MSRSESSAGYKRPPANRQFVKGKSGNPSGRPKGKRAGSDLASLMNMLVTVTLDGTPRQVPLAEATALSLAQRGLSGNTAAAREFMKIADKVAAKKEVEELPKIGLVKLVPMYPVEVSDSNTALEKLGVIEAVASRWRICTWVIEAALARNDRLLSEEKDRNLIAENMLHPEAMPRILQSA